MLQENEYTVVNISDEFVLNPSPFKFLYYTVLEYKGTFHNTYPIFSDIFTKLTYSSYHLATTRSLIYTKKNDNIRFNMNVTTTFQYFKLLHSLLQLDCISDIKKGFIKNYINTLYEYYSKYLKLKQKTNAKTYYYTKYVNTLISGNITKCENFKMNVKDWYAKHIHKNLDTNPIDFLYCYVFNNTQTKHKHVFIKDLLQKEKITIDTNTLSLLYTDILTPYKKLPLHFDYVKCIINTFTNIIKSCAISNDKIIVTYEYTKKLITQITEYLKATKSKHYKQSGYNFEYMEITKWLTWLQNKTKQLSTFYNNFHKSKPVNIFKTTNIQKHISEENEHIVCISFARYNDNENVQLLNTIFNQTLKEKFNNSVFDNTEVYVQLENKYLKDILNTKNIKGYSIHIKNPVSEHIATKEIATVLSYLKTSLNNLFIFQTSDNDKNIFTIEYENINSTNIILKCVNRCFEILYE